MEINNLSFCYPGEPPLFEGFGFSSSSPLVVLRGASGCGKTTLLKILFGGIQGDLSFDKLELPSKAFLILQDDALCPWLTGIQNIVNFIPCSISDFEQLPLYKHTKSFINKKTCNLSFGQRRLIELLRAFVFGPDLLLLDEPLNYLDAQSRGIVVNEIINYINVGNRQVILTDHIKQSFDALSHVTYSFPEAKPITELYREE